MSVTVAMLFVDLHLSAPVFLVEVVYLDESLTHLSHSWYHFLSPHDSASTLNPKL